MMQYWENVEASLSAFNNYKQKESPKHLIRYVAFTILFFAIGIYIIQNSNLRKYSIMSEDVFCSSYS